MLIIPAIDIKGGQCVRLAQGRMDAATVYGDDPAAMAARWVQAGARRLHVVDLDGAVQGKPVHTEAVHAIIANHPEIPVQIGGGVRSRGVIAAHIEAGARYVIIGTRAITDPQFVASACREFPGRIMVGLDARDGQLATDGWSSVSRQSATGAARQFADQGVAAVIFTDIRRDGMMDRINTAAIRALCADIDIPVIASGGLCGLDDVRDLCRMRDAGVQGGIIGRALYEGVLELGAAQTLADQLTGNHGAGQTHHPLP